MTEAAGKDYVQELKLVERKGELDAHNAFLQKILDGVSKEQSDEARLQATQQQTQAGTINEVMKQLAPMLQQAMTPQQAPMRQPTQGIPTPQPNQLPTADQSKPITGVPTDFVAAMRSKRGDLEAIKKQLKAASSSAAWEKAIGGRNTYNINMLDALTKESGLTKDEINAVALEAGISEKGQRLKLDEKKMLMLEKEYERKLAKEPVDEMMKLIETFAKDTESPSIVRRELIRKGIEHTAAFGKEPTRQDMLRFAGELPQSILKGKGGEKSKDRYVKVGDYLFDTETREYIAAPKDPTQVEGKGFTAQQYNKVSSLASKIQRGEQLTPEERRAYSYSIEYLNTPKTFMDQESGQIVTYKPNITKVFPPLPGEAAPEAPPKPTGPTIEKTGANKKSKLFDEAVSIMTDVADILVDAKKRGEIITGVEGKAKAVGGGLARQAGIPVTPAASNLDRKLKLLGTMLSPEILKEKKVTDSERRVVEDIVGKLTWTNDEVEIREALKELAQWLKRNQL